MPHLRNAAELQAHSEGEFRSTGIIFPIGKALQKVTVVISRNGQFSSFMAVPPLPCPGWLKGSLRYRLRPRSQVARGRKGEPYYTVFARWVPRSRNMAPRMMYAMVVTAFRRI